MKLLQPPRNRYRFELRNLTRQFNDFLQQKILDGYEDSLHEMKIDEHNYEEQTKLLGTPKEFAIAFKEGLQISFDPSDPFINAYRKRFLLSVLVSTLSILVSIGLILLGFEEQSNPTWVNAIEKSRIYQFLLLYSLIGLFVTLIVRYLVTNLDDYLQQQIHWTSWLVYTIVFLFLIFQDNIRFFFFDWGVQQHNLPLFGIFIVYIIPTSIMLGLVLSFRTYLHTNNNSSENS